MRYHVLIAADDGSGQPPVFSPVGTISSEAPNPVLQERIASECFLALGRAVADTGEEAASAGAPTFARPGKPSGRPGKPISIRAIAEEREPYLAFKVGDIIGSSMELSLLLGFSYNMACQKISNAARKRAEFLLGILDPIERKKIESEPLEVEIRGVTFCYVEELAKNEN